MPQFKKYEKWLQVCDSFCGSAWSSTSLFINFFLPFSFSIFSNSVSIYRTTQHHQTQVSMAWPLDHFCEPAKSFTWCLLSFFHLWFWSKQKHRKDEKEMVSERPEWADRGWFKANLRCFDLFLITYFATKIPCRFFSFSKKYTDMNLSCSHTEFKRRKWMTTVSSWQIYTSKNTRWIIGCRRTLSPKSRKKKKKRCFSHCMSWCLNPRWHWDELEWVESLWEPLQENACRKALPAVYMPGS